MEQGEDFDFYLDLLALWLAEPSYLVLPGRDLLLHY